jgi:septal ring factor EnvC (AmiA/AmiB activator)
MKNIAYIIYTNIMNTFSKKPRTVSVIISEMDAKANELRKRAEFDKTTRTKIVDELSKLDDDTQTKIDDLKAEQSARQHELDIEDTKLKDSVERAERIAERVENFAS